MANTKIGWHSGSITFRDALITGPSLNAITIDNTKCNLTMTNAITVSGTVTNLFNFDNASSVCTQTGTAATTWSGRIKVITPDGSAGYINVYSTSNE